MVGISSRALAGRKRPSSTALLNCRATGAFSRVTMSKAEDTVWNEPMLVPMSGRCFPRSHSTPSVADAAEWVSCRIPARVRLAPSKSPLETSCWISRALALASSNDREALHAW